MDIKYSNEFVDKLYYGDEMFESSENGIKDFFIEVDESYEEIIKGDLIDFLKNIGGLDKEIYINYVNGIEGYRIEPLIFKNQKEHITKYLVKIE